MSRAILLAVALSVSLPASLAWGDPTPTELAEARKKFDAALKLEKAGDYKGALATMREVAAVKSTANVRFHIALCLEKLGKLVDARTEYLRVKEEADAKEGADAAALAQKTADRVADLDARIPKLTIKIPEDIITAKLSVDGGPPVNVIVNPLVRLDPGEHKLQITSPGRATFKRTVTVKERDETVTIQPEFPVSDEAEPEPEPVKPEPVATTPPPVVHRDVAPKTNPLPFVVGGVGLAVLATGGVFYALADSARHDLDQACGENRDKCPSSMKSTEDRGRLYTTTANIFMGVGAAALGTAVVIWVLQPAPRRPIAASVSPSPVGMTFSLSGSF